NLSVSVLDRAEPAGEHPSAPSGDARRALLAVWLGTSRQGMHGQPEVLTLGVESRGRPTDDRSCALRLCPRSARSELPVPGAPFRVAAILAASRPRIPGRGRHGIAGVVPAHP